MPNTLRELHSYIQAKADREEISRPVAMFATGWIFFDLFERADHEQAMPGAQPITCADLDRFARELPEQKIDRDIEDAQQSFGEAAYDFLEPDTKKRIQKAIDDSVVATVRNYTSSMKAFGLNVLAGVVAGAVFAAASLGLYFYVRIDPSNVMGKTYLDSQSRQGAAPAANSPSSPAKQGE